MTRLDGVSWDVGEEPDSVKLGILEDRELVTREGVTGNAWTNDEGVGALVKSEDGARGDGVGDNDVGGGLG